ncbi:inositol monophosphatase family protein [Paradevosia shaoguanensis]|uniref:inositol monophosphatase family protein n=1 Tax=Paradevosia shaoguanensis TaxID=1335043 RepID=UPI001933310A|nr:inositol monophosphatase family protein [Paradevosia shaoguanensis]
MTTPSQSIQLRQVAEKAARLGGDPLLGVFRSGMDYGYQRDRHDIVTEHDRASEARIIAAITGAVPDSTIIGEEGGEVGTGRVRWYVDPIDGTSNFARGIANWCVSIGAAIGEELVAGVIYDPVAGNMFAADLATVTLNGTPIRVNAEAEQHRAVLLTGFPNTKHTRLFGRQALDAYDELLDAFLAIRTLGSGALNLAHVAAGWSDAAMGFRTNSWDVGAGAFILERAGGRYFGFRDGVPTTPGFLMPDYIAVGRDSAYPVLAAVMARLTDGTANDRILSKEALGS